MKAGKCQAKGEKAKNKKKFNILERRQVKCPAKGEKAKNNKQKQQTTTKKKTRKERKQG